MKIQFKKEWSEADFKKAKTAIRLHFKFATYATHKGMVTFGSSYNSIDAILGLAYTSSSSIAMLGVCNIQLNEDSQYHYNHFAISLDGKVYAELWDKDENVKLIQL